MKSTYLHDSYFHQVIDNGSGFIYNLTMDNRTKQWYISCYDDRFEVVLWEQWNNENPFKRN